MYLHHGAVPHNLTHREEEEGLFLITWTVVVLQTPHLHHGKNREICPVKTGCKKFDPIQNWNLDT